MTHQTLTDSEMPRAVHHKNGVALILVYLFVMYTCGYASYTYLRRHMLATDQGQASRPDPDPEHLHLVQEPDESARTHKGLTSALLADNNPSHRTQHKHHQHYHRQSGDQEESAYNSAHQNDQSGHAHTSYTYLRRHMLANQSVTCNDGTVAGYYLRRAYNSRRWIIFLEGGWYCFSAVTCHQRWLKMRQLMTSAHWPEAKSGESLTV